MPEDKPYHVSPEGVLSLITGKKHKQTGILWPVEEGEHVLPDRWRISSHLHEPPLEHIYYDFDDAARQAYMRGWSYHRVCYIPGTDDPFEIHVEPQQPKWLVKVWYKGAWFGATDVVESLEEAKRFALGIVYPDVGELAGDLLAIAKEEWDEIPPSEPI